MAPITISPPLPASQPHSLFLSKLCPELRNTIYELALSNTTYTGGATCWPIYIEGGPLEDRYEVSKQPLALLATYRQIYHEAAGFYFNIHHIGFLVPHGCYAFSAEVGARHVEAVKILTVMCGAGEAGEQAREFVKAAVGFARLEVLTLRIQEEEGVDGDEVLGLVVDAVTELEEEVEKLVVLGEVVVDAEPLGVVPGVVGVVPQFGKLERVRVALNEGVTKK
ncbi:hypothetical protein CLAFUW4_03980 [Fulvia fulva]|uniref:Uncharacterized protein n=1 Tax=Passalora fulva TaxID=5499 RepID=A0A9Q8P8C1_PASFU|nr:uncharacterized protein CLAFUR5_03944 [Fulvia fulva]KAK4626366.1 hypothetical protein CLAFUR4_03966 [Fulvia fulva]KAK4628606.1 hypothetical protein CLAFUR0_03967 [Fulvia fulva]UJO17070.1 hypothetical protein CLAFUR5_03944 [Fulvia fulva]WPV13793.1 hypothetical protein CLAFUW4_03980 [Fulvia fulva]WPV28288.1 hypothetical protein CLAFUW7_03969 [Fulvia fulva]